MRVFLHRLPSICLLAFALAVPAAALTPPELTGSVSPAAATTSDLVEVSLFHPSRDCPLEPSDVVVVAAPPGEGYDHIVRVRLVRDNENFSCQTMSGTDFLPIGPSFAVGPLEPGDYLVEAAWEDQTSAAAIFTVSGPPPVREGSGLFARPLPSTGGAHEIFIADVPNIEGCAFHTFDLVATQVDGTLVHVFFEERSWSLSCAGSASPGDVRAVIGPLPYGASYTAVVWLSPEAEVLKPQILWGTAPLLGTGRGSDGACSPHTLCLAGRFAVWVRWATAQDQGFGEPVRLTRDTGAFWFFDRDNLELVVKVLDACGPFGHHWVFLSGLTDVEVEVEVLDGATGERKKYRNEAGEHFRPRFDTAAFGCP